ncbi:MAG: TIR domain-containing protein, partial [Mycobacterium sp.]
MFISFDYDHDLDVKNLLVLQAKNPDSPFEIIDWSIKEASADWKAKARQRIRASDVVVVLCGEHTDTAVGVAAELSITQE